MVVAADFIAPHQGDLALAGGLAQRRHVQILVVEERRVQAGHDADGDAGAHHAIQRFAVDHLVQARRAQAMLAQRAGGEFPDAALGKHDDFLPRQLFPAHFLERRQRMASRRHQHQLVFEQAHAFQRDGTGHLDTHAKVQLARMQRMQQAIVGHVRQDDFHFIAMPLAVARHHHGRHRHGRRDRADADAVAAAADGALDIGKSVARRIQ